MDRFNATKEEVVKAMDVLQSLDARGELRKELIKAELLLRRLYESLDTPVPFPQARRTTMTLKPLTKDDVVISIDCSADVIPVRGNAMASGDPAVDKEVEDEVIRQLNSGNEWAWCSITVTATWESLSGKEYSASDHLGCCSYKSKQDFIEAGDYYPDMVNNALTQLNADLFEICDDLRALYEAS